jgi:NTE family protein
LGEWRLIGKLGEGLGLFAEFYQPLESSLSWFVNPIVSFNRNTTNLYFDYNNLATILDTSSQFGVQFGRNISNVGRIKGFWEFSYDHYEIQTGSILIPDGHSRTGDVGIAFEWDTVDNVFFPHHGLKGHIALSTFDRGFGGDSHFSQLDSSALVAFSSGKHAIVFGGKYERTLDETPAFNSLFSLGGLFELTGLSRDELMANNAALVNAIYFYELTKLKIIPNRPGKIYLGVSLETGKAWEDANLTDNQFVTSGSLFLGIDSILGPIYLAFGMTDNGRKAAHLEIRPVFK